MAPNSIKQNIAKTFRLFGPEPTVKFDANILVNLLNNRAESVSNRAGWVLVGGRSSRMGRNKAKAESAGRALALRVADRIRAASGGTVSLVGDPAQYNDLGLPVVPDLRPGEGPLAGIEAALEASTKQYNLIVACDMPEISEALLERLFSESADCAVPQKADGRLEPLCAVYSKACLAPVREALNSGIRKVTDALGLLAETGCAIRYVRVTDPASFANLNTPEDWRRYHHG
jgi:molybdopterin-guanine dinucleotide biosynthesis protein A